MGSRMARIFLCHAHEDKPQVSDVYQRLRALGWQPWMDKMDLLPGCGLSHIVADFRQIMWRKFLRNLCQYSAMTQKALPHNLAWPFLPFLPSWCCPLSAAILCGRKSPMAPKMAPMLKQRVLRDNVAP